MYYQSLPIVKRRNTMAATDTRSILNYLEKDESFGLSSRITIRGEACIAIGLDNGNDAAKITMLNDLGKAVTIRIPTAHQLAKTFQGGQGEVTYQLGDDASFWIGEGQSEMQGGRYAWVQPRPASPT